MNKIIHLFWLTFLVLLTILYTNLHNRIELAERQLKTKADLKVVKQRAKFVNIYLHDLEYKYNEIHSLAGSAYDIAEENVERYDWTIGLTTKEIDSILVMRNDS